MTTNPQANPEANPLQPMVERSKVEPFFLGFHLHAYAERHSLTDGELAARLGCDVARLPRLMLCGWPDPAGERFAENVHAIAGFVGCDEAALLAVLRGE